MITGREYMYSLFALTAIPCAINLPIHSKPRAKVRSQRPEIAPIRVKVQFWEKRGMPTEGT